jgi:LmbE family N-acetylglucosaminyl deacetylase
LLVAFAHPDDESFGPAGTIVHYARQDVAVHLVCATRGEAGDADAELLEGYGSLAELRSQELLCAAVPLGLAGVHFLDYHDSGMENTPANGNPTCLFQAPLEDVAEGIARLIRQIRPQVVLTFDPTGGSFHPDHIKMHQATTLAFHTAGDPGSYPQQLAEGLEPYQPRKLYYTAMPRQLLKVAVKIMPLFGQDPAALGRNKDMNLKRMAAVEQVITTRINVSAYHEARQRAVACHASQAFGNDGRAFGLLSRWLFRYESFTRAVPPFEERRAERDLFAEINAELG